MSFQLPDLIIESVIRDGLLGLREHPEIIDDVFGSLNLSYTMKKYGKSELAKIKTLIQERDVAVVHSFHEVNARVPAYSIQLTTDVEWQQVARLDDFDTELVEDISDPRELANLVVIPDVIATSYDEKTGTLYVDDSIDLTPVYANLFFEDVSGNSFQIKGGIVNVSGSKQFLIEAQSNVDISSPGLIKSSLDYTKTEIRSVHSTANILVGVHTKDALTTKYLYILLKYFLLSRKKDLIERDFIISSYNGSDFTRDLRYEGDIVYTRFLTVGGKVCDSWRSDQVALIDRVLIELGYEDC